MADDDDGSMIIDMEMYFSTDSNVTDFLFQNWNATTGSELFLMCLAMAALTFILEAIKTLQDYWITKQKLSRRSNAVIDRKVLLPDHPSIGSDLRRISGMPTRPADTEELQPMTGRPMPGYGSTLSLPSILRLGSGAWQPNAVAHPRGSRPCDRDSEEVRVARSQAMWQHVTQTCVMALQVTVGYLLMLAVMSYNVWIVLTVCASSTVAYFVFAMVRHSVRWSMYKNLHADNVVDEILRSVSS